MNQKIRTLIADDEAPALSKMKRLLEKFPEIEVIYAAENGEEALEKIMELKPQLIFLDVEMPGLTGLEVAEQIDIEPFPVIVFATAYHEHAIKAFEMNASDYLLKPFNEDRLSVTMERVRQILATQSHFTHENEPPENFPVINEENFAPFHNKIPVPTRDRYRLLDFDELICIEVDDRNLRLSTVDKSYLLNLSLEALEKKLPPDRFLRVSRSCIVGLKHIKEIIIWFGNRFKIVLSNDKEVVSSRERSKFLKQALRI